MRTLRPLVPPATKAMVLQDFVEEASVRCRAFEEQRNPGPILVAAGLYKDGEQVFLPADPGLDLADPSRHGLLRGLRDPTGPWGGGRRRPGRTSRPAPRRRGKPSLPRWHNC